MKKSKNTFESPPVCEALEPRILLSVASIGVSESLDFADVPVYLSVDLLAGYSQQDNDIVSSEVRQVQKAIEDTLVENPTADLSQLSSGEVYVNQNGDLHVYVHVDKVNQSAVQSLQAAGLTLENANEAMRVVQGWVNHTFLDSLAAIEGVRRITAPTYAVTNAGSITTAGDGILNADDLRSEMNVTGNGVKIGVIANGLDHWDNVDDSGDLPSYSSGITVHPTFSGKGDEGTALLEIIHDLAPDTDLFFAGYRDNGTFSSADMVGAIEWMVNQGVDVIVDDLGFFDQPMFEDGAIADAAADAVSDGVVYVTAAGNYADEQHYQVDYADYGDGTHEFATDQNILRFYLGGSGGSVRGEMQWSDAWGSSGNNYDLYLYQWTGSSWSYAAASTDVQNGNDDPREWIRVTNNGESPALLAWLIHKDSGLDRELEFYMRGDRTDFSIYASDTGIMTPGDSIFGHTAVESVITVGAIDASEPGNDAVESFSSRGPSTIYTDFANQISTTRNSLDVCGIDGVNTKVGDLGYFSDPFYGTSAAAPHIAAIAGLLLEIDSTLTPAQVQDLINDNAVDILDSGYDHTSGYGRADALATVTTAATSVDLLAASDTGVSSSDDQTNLDNHDTNSKLQFDVSGTINGATVKLYGPGDVVIGQGTGNGGTLTITTNGSQDLADGVNGIYARQTVTDKLESAATSSLNVTVDTLAPSAPSAPDLQAGSDLGSSNTDNITKDNTPTFDLTGASPYFRFYRDTTQISGDYETGPTYTAATQTDGTDDFKVAAVDVAGNESAQSSALSVTIDTVAPEVSANPTINDGATQRDSIKSIEFDFDEDVSIISSALEMYYYDGDSWETTSLSSPTFTQPSNDKARWENTSGLLTVDDKHLIIKLLAANLTDIAGNAIVGNEVIGEDLFRLHKLSGDVDGNKAQEGADIDTLRSYFGNNAYDLDGDSDTDEDDVAELVEQIFATFYGDVDLDGLVASTDYNAILFNWGMSNATWEDGDLSGDGFVGMDDYAILLNNWGSYNPDFSLLDLGDDPAWS